MSWLGNSEPFRKSTPRREWQVEWWRKPTGRHFDGGSGEEIGGEGDEKDVINANLINDIEHGLQIRRRDPRFLRRGLDGPTRGLDTASRGLNRG